MTALGKGATMQASPRGQGERFRQCAMGGPFPYQERKEAWRNARPLGTALGHQLRLSAIHRIRGP